jgi:hypothetical protein
VWLFIVAPLIGAGIAGYLFKSRILAAQDVIPERGAAKSDGAPGTPASDHKRSSAKARKPHVRACSQMLSKLRAVAAARP